MENISTLIFDKSDYFYNKTHKKVAFLTMDVDWASDEVLEWTLNWFISHELPITAFTTHHSKVAQKFSQHPLVEIAIHPNFSKTLEPEVKVKNLLNHYPESIGSRSHRNIIGRDYTDILNQHKLKYDSSKLLWRGKNLEVYALYNGMVDIPYNWEDGVHLELNESGIVNTSEFNFTGLKILNIHPVLFFLNHRSFKQLKSFTSQFKDLTSVPFEEFEKARHAEEGIGTYSRDLFLALKKDGYNFHLIKELAIPANDFLKHKLANQNYWY